LAGLTGRLLPVLLPVLPGLTILPGLARLPVLAGLARVGAGLTVLRLLPVLTGLLLAVLTGLLLAVARLARSLSGLVRVVARRRRSAHRGPF
jgi:hypothetical protein